MQKYGPGAFLPSTARAKRKSLLFIYVQGFVLQSPFSKVGAICVQGAAAFPRRAAKAERPERHSAGRRDAWVARFQFRAGQGEDRLEVVLLDVLEVLVGAVGDAFAGSLIANDDAVLVHLKHADGPHLRHGAFDGSLKGAGLVVAVAEDEYFLGRHHGARAYGQRRGGNVVGVAAEEAGVGHAGVGGERLDARASRE